MANKKSKQNKKKQLIKYNYKFNHEIQIVSNDAVELTPDPDLPEPPAPSNDRFKIGDFVLVSPTCGRHTRPSLKRGPFAAQIESLSPDGQSGCVSHPVRTGKYGWFSRANVPVSQKQIPFDALAQLQHIAPVDLTPNGNTKNLKAFLRGLISFDELTQNARPFHNFIVSHPVRLTPEDLLCALRRIFNPNSSATDILINYALPIYHVLYKSIGISYIRDNSILFNDDTQNELFKLAFMIPHDASHAVCYCLYRLNHFDISDTLSDHEQKIKQLIEYLETYFKNIGKPVSDYEVAPCEKHNFLNHYFHKIQTQQAVSDIKTIYYKTLDELLKRSDKTALNIKAWSCYGGNHLFACDWDESARCLNILADDYDDISAVCALGYIYYYGRISAPDYDKAIQCFTVASLNGDAQASCKLLDIMYNAQGLPRKDPVIFNKLCSLHKTEIDIFFYETPCCAFADVAWRLGRCYEEGIGTNVDLAEAYKYYLQSYIALVLRKPFKQYGDPSVRKRLEDKITELIIMRLESENHLHFDIWMDPWPNDYYIPEEIHSPAVQTALRHLIAPYRITSKSEENPQRDARECEANSPAPETKFDDENTIILDDQNDERLNAQTDACDFYDDAPDEPSNLDAFDQHLICKDEVRHFVSIEFTDAGKRFDYLCDDMTICPGDFVIVPTPNGQKTVKVCGVADKAVSSLPLPLERYRSIVGRAL